MCTIAKHNHQYRVASPEHTTGSTPRICRAPPHPAHSTFLSQTRHTLHFHIRPHGQRRHGHARPRRLGMHILKDTHIDLIESGKILHLRKEDGHLDRVLEGRSGG